MRILVFILLVSSIGPLIRFYKSKFFYYFFLYAVMDPIVYFVSNILNFHNLISSIYLFANLLIIYALPNLKYKYKLGFTIFLLIFSLADRSEVTDLLMIIFIFIFILIYIANSIINTMISSREIILFLVPLFVIYFTGAIMIYLYYADPSLVLSTINYKLSLYIILNILITVWGPTKTFSIEKYFPFPPLQFDKEFSDNYLIISGLSAREIEVYKFLIRGYSNNEIADKMFIEKRTVESHLSHIKDKLSFESMNELRRYIAHIIKKRVST